MGVLLLLLPATALAAFAQTSLDSTLVPYLVYRPSVLGQARFLLEAGVLFLLPGLAIASLLFRKPGPGGTPPLGRLRFLSVAILCSTLVGYAFFWVYFWSVPIGCWTSRLVPPLAAVIVAVRATKLWRTGRGVPPGPGRPAVIEFCNWVVAVFLVAGFFISLTLLYEFSPEPLAQAQLRFMPGRLPPDNTLPFVVAQRMFHGVPTRPFLYEDWKASDRPPLQTGLALAQMPWWGPEAQQRFHYQSLAVFLQCLWVAALGILFERSGLGRKTCVLALGFSVTAGFFLVNCIFVWPKLLAASLVILGLSFTPLLGVEPGEWRARDAMWAAIAFALALLSHGGAAFTILGAGLLSILSRRLPPVRVAALAAFAGLLVLLPWQMYQKFYDPPGDRLLKCHLAGQEKLTNLSFGQTLRQSYGRLTLRKFLHNKIENLKVLSGIDHPLPFHKGSLRERLRFFLEGSFFVLSQTLGLLNAGFLIRLIRRREERAADRLLLIAGIAIVVWCLLMFLPRSTTLHQGSMADFAFIFAALGIYIVRCLPPAALAVFYAVHGMVFGTFVLAKPIIARLTPGEPPVLFRAPMAAVALVLAVAIACWGWRYATAKQGGQTGLSTRAGTARGQTSLSRRLPKIH